MFYGFNALSLVTLCILTHSKLRIWIENTFEKGWMRIFVRILFILFSEFKVWRQNLKFEPWMPLDAVLLRDDLVKSKDF